MEHHQAVSPLNRPTSSSAITSRQNRRPPRSRSAIRLAKSSNMLAGADHSEKRIVEDRKVKTEKQAEKKQFTIAEKHRGKPSAHNLTREIKNIAIPPPTHTKSSERLQPASWDHKKLVPHSAVQPLASPLITALDTNQSPIFLGDGQTSSPKASVSHQAQSSRSPSEAFAAHLSSPEVRQTAGSYTKCSSVVPRQLHNIRPRLDASAILDTLPQAIQSPLASEQRRARLRAIMPDLKSFRALKDCDIPLPEPYNAAYPHPISAYASPGVNPAALAASGYEKVLQDLLSNDPNRLKGGILASASRDDILPPALTMILSPGEGNGIPERLWTRFESIGAARLPVGIAAASPYARIEPATGDVVAIPPRFAATEHALWDAVGQVEPVTLSDTSRSNYSTHRYRRSSASELAAWRSELSGPQFIPPSNDSAWYKTEICCVWEDTGLCKYGATCQYAHGLHELRLPTDIDRLPTPVDHALSDTYQLPEGCLPYIRSLSQHSSAGVPRSDGRRASIAPKDLPTVGEFEEDITASCWRREAFAPIGAERKLFVTSVYCNDAENTDDIPSAGKHLTKHKSISSLSTASSRYSGYSSDCSPNATQQMTGSFSPFENPDTKQPSDWQCMVGSTTLDFSTGHSIWC